MLPSRTVGSKGGVMPYIQRIGRLHVVVAVEQHGRFARRMQPVGVDQRMIGGGNHFDVLQPARFIASATKDAARTISGLCSGSVLTLGMRRNVFSSSRRRASFSRTKMSTDWDMEGHVYYKVACPQAAIVTRSFTIIARPSPEPNPGTWEDSEPATRLRRCRWRRREAGLIRRLD